MRLQRSLEGDEPEINLISLIDVIFCIIVFLVVTTTFDVRTALRLQLPSAQGAALEASDEPLTVVVDAEIQPLHERSEGIVELRTQHGIAGRIGAYRPLRNLMVLDLALAIFGKLPLRMLALAATNQHGAIDLPQPLHGGGQVVGRCAAQVDRDADGYGGAGHIKSL